MTVHDLFNAIDVDKRLDNPFVTDKGEELYKYACEASKRPEIDVSEIIANILMLERENAFTIGFRTAIELLFSAESVKSI